jgi:hypothetical protein
VAIVVMLVVLQIPRNDNPDNKTVMQRIRQLDLIGASVLVPSVICLLLALQWGGSTYPWHSPRIIGLFVGFGLLISIFIGIQLKLGDAGTLPPRLFKNRDVALACLYALFFGAAFFSLIFYLAVYFQSIKGSSATKAGIQLLPLLISSVISSIVTGALITLLGYYTPFMIVCTAIFAVGSGLITTFDISTPFARWFGYQLLAGVGVGVGFQAALLVVQTSLPLSDVPVGTACVNFFQTLGGALFISVAQTVFQNGLIEGIHKSLPDLDPQIFLHSGATQIRKVLQSLGREGDLNRVLQAYVEGLSDCYFITVACSIAAFFVACGLRWRSVKKAKVSSPEEKGIGMVPPL